MGFSQSLQKNITASDRIGAELATNFTEISGNVESQTELITNINSEIDLETNYIDEIAKQSSLMHALSENTLSKTQECNREIAVASDQSNLEISQIPGSAKETLASLQEGLAGMQEQSAGLEMIANNFRDLEKLIQVLENIS